MRATAIWYEMVILAMCLILGANVMVQFVNTVSEPMISYTNEKTAVDTDDVISWFDANNKNSNVRYGKDLLLALLNTDEYACYPNAIKIDDSPIFELNMAFQTQKATKMQELYDPRGQYALGDPSRLAGKIRACVLENEYKRDASGNLMYAPTDTGRTTPLVERQYLHYYILKNP